MPLPSRRLFLLWTIPVIFTGGALLWMAVSAGGNPPDAGALSEGKHRTQRKKIEQLTGGWTKLAWVRDVAGGKDPFAHHNQMRLMGLDTRDEQGIRPLVESVQNFSRPLITPDGTAVLYTVRNGDDEPLTNWKPVIWRVGWEGKAPERLRDGYAVDIWQDPAGTAWVYAAKRMKPGRGPNPDGFAIVRFRLTDPATEEPVWSQGMVTLDNFQVNRSATAASGLLPWPNAGRFDFASRQFLRHTQGCWPSLAPDDSGLSWVFDGAHENLRMYLPSLAGSWKVKLSRADGIGGKAVYHPRWSNDPHFIAFTGPYKGSVSKGGKQVEIVIGKFNESATKLEKSVNLQDSAKSPDFYPDLWIDGGAAHSLDTTKLGPDALRSAPPPPAAAENWDVAPDGLCFRWEHALSANTAPGPEGERACAVKALRYARFDQNRAMRMDGGWFAADEASAAAVGDALRAGAWSAEFAMTPLAKLNNDETVVLSAGAELEIRQQAFDLIIQRRGAAWRLGAGLAPGHTTHFAIGAGDATTPPVAMVNGTAQVLRPADPTTLTETPGLVFGADADGSHLWGGVLEGVAIHGKSLDEARAGAHAAWWQKTLTARSMPPVTVVRARLEEASPVLEPGEIAPYFRAWTAANWKRVELVSGPDPGESFTVAHWTVLDRETVPGFPAPGSEATLTLEPLASHPEMDSERGSDEVSSETLPFFLETATPGTRGKSDTTEKK